MCRRLMRRGRLLISLFLLCLVSACATTEPVPHCCYRGPIVSAHLDQLYFVLESGERKSYREIFPGLTADTRFFTRALAFDEADVDLVIYPTLIELLPRYDANEDTLIEVPELTVLYLVEGARGLGQPVERIELVDSGVQVRALNLPQSERGGLALYLSSRRDEMPLWYRTMFRELEDLGHDIRTYSEGPDNDREGFKLKP